MSSEVKAFSLPPLREMIFEYSSGPCAFVPLNIMCSSMWLRPVTPGVSLREPTRYQTCTTVTGALWSSRSSILSPLSSVRSTTCSA